MELHRPAVYKPAGADLWPLQILEYRQRTVEAARGLPQHHDPPRMFFVRPVREVEPCDIHTRVDQTCDHIRAARGWADRGDDFSSAHLIPHHCESRIADCRL